MSPPGEPPPADAPAAHRLVVGQVQPPLETTPEELLRVLGLTALRNDKLANESAMLRVAVAERDARIAELEAELSRFR